MLSKQGFALVVVAGWVAFMACGPSRGGDDAGTNTDAGRTDGGTNGGTDGGGGTDAGTDGGVLEATIGQLRNNLGLTGRTVLVKDVVVHTVAYLLQGTGGDYRAEFWVVDPANPKEGIWVEKFYSDTPTGYAPAVGDKLTIKGVFKTDASFADRTGYRMMLANAYPGPAPLELTKTGTGSRPAANAVASGSFGDAQDGTVRASPDYGGSRVHIAGPLTVTDRSPPAMRRYSLGQATSTYYGYEVTGGILVNNFYYYREDAGCPELGRPDAGHVFTNGLKGTWDTYTHAPCIDGGSDPKDCFKARGYVPGTDAGFTYVLYPSGCADVQ
jgi:hypothetical protein